LPATNWWHGIAGGYPEIFAALQARDICNLLVCGIESHICVQQTVPDRLGSGWWVYVPADAVGPHFEIDYRTALRRPDSSSITLITTESAPFEWCQVAVSPALKQPAIRSDTIREYR